MITYVDKRNDLRAEFDIIVEKNGIENLSSPEMVSEALKFEKMILEEN